MKKSPRGTTFSLEQQTLIALLSTAEAITTSATRLVANYGLTFTQYNALRILRGAGAEGLPCSEISERMITRDSDITRLLDRLEQMELVKRNRDANDRRIVRTSASRRGLKLLSDMDDSVSRWDHDNFSHLGEKGMRSIVDLLDRLRQPLQQQNVQHCREHKV